jgi:hypothetical protein
LQKFLTEFSDRSKRVEALNTAVKGFVELGHSEVFKVQERQENFLQMWQGLNWLKRKKKFSLEKAFRYLSFLLWNLT